jgi:hypothetical protein
MLQFVFPDFNIFSIQNALFKFKSKTILLLRFNYYKVFEKPV